VLIVYRLRSNSLNFDDIIECVVLWLKYRTVSNNVFLTYSEFEMVREADLKLLQENLSKLKILYAKVDGWCPLQYYRELKQKIPKIDAQVCEGDVPHAYVEGYSSTVSQYCAKNVHSLNIKC